VGGGDEKTEGVGVVARTRGESGIIRFGACDEGGGVIDEEGGGGELYFIRSTCGKDVGLSGAKEFDGDDGLPTIIEDVGDMAWGTSMVEGSIAC
jgi:hypothetical protein